MRSITSSARALAARAGAVALAVPMLLGGAVPASAAIVSHVMAPAVGTGSQYEPLTADEGLGVVRFTCQLTNPPSCYGPDQIRGAYDIQSVLDSGVTGAGQTIVIIDAFQSPTITTDLARFDTIWKLPAPSAFKVIAPDGLTPFDQTKGNQRSWSAEISLDVEWAHAVAPGAAIDLVLAKSDQDADILSATQYAVDHNLGDVISQSFGEAEMCADPNLIRQEHAIFGTAGDKGITLFASSGDQGAAQPTCDGTAFFKSASTPASDPDVTGVGGTALTTAGTNGQYQSESAWSATGGGFSTIYRRPGYQAPLQDNNKQRGVPDVAYDADTVHSGVIVVWSAFAPTGTFQYWRFGGTSVGSPQWAGIVALADQKGGHRLGAINTTLYHIGKSGAYGSAFHDIRSGNNSFGAVTGFAAAPGVGRSHRPGDARRRASHPPPDLMAKGQGTKQSPWDLKTPSGSPEYQMYKDETANPPALVCLVGKTELRYQLRAIDDLYKMLKANGDWVPLGSADEQKPAAEGTVEAWGRSTKNPVGGWYGLRKGYRGRFGMYMPPLLEALGLAEVEHNPKNNRMRAL